MPDILQWQQQILYKNKHITTDFYKNVKENNVVTIKIAINMEYDPA